jgi:hypothetical protein
MSMDDPKFFFYKLKFENWIKNIGKHAFSTKF